MMQLGLKTCIYTILKVKLQNEMLLTRLQWLIIMRITNSDGNCGKIIIATLFCTLLIGIRITTMYSSATTKVVATPITTTNVRESYEIKDGVPVETIITSFGPDTQLDYMETVTDTRGKDWHKVSLQYSGITRTGYISADFTIKSTIEVTVPDANSSTNNGKKKLR